MNENYRCGYNGMRSFLTREERIEILKEYKENLENEAKGVSERIKELEKEK
jgi:methyltransferase-like protein